MLREEHGRCRRSIIIWIKCLIMERFIANHYTACHNGLFSALLQVLCLKFSLYIIMIFLLIINHLSLCD